MKKLWVLSIGAILVSITCVSVMFAMDPIVEEGGSGEQVIRTYTSIHALVKDISRLPIDVFEGDLRECISVGLDINRAEYYARFSKWLTPLDYVELQLRLIARQVVTNKQFISQQEQHTRAHQILERHGGARTEE